MDDTGDDRPSSSSPFPSSAGRPVGLLISTRQAALGTATVRELVDLAVLAERTGIGSIWVGESIVARPRPDMFGFLAACAAVTSDIRLGTATALPALHHPLRFAHQIASLDQLAGGRLVVGVGSGFPVEGTRQECEVLGVDYRTRRATMEDVVAAARAALAGEPIAGSLAGGDGVVLEPRPWQRPVPFWLGGEGSRAKERCGACYDGWMPTTATPERLAAGIADVRAAAERAGRDPDQIEVATILTVLIDHDPAAAERDLTTYLQRYYRTDAPLELITDIVGTFAGTPEQCAERVAEFLEAGADQVILRLAVDDQAAALRDYGADLLRAGSTSL